MQVLWCSFFFASFVVHRMDFVSKVRKCQEKEMPRENHENEKPPQDKGDVKKKVSKEHNFNRKRRQKNVNTKGYREIGAKRKPCQENGM